MKNSPSSVIYHARSSLFRINVKFGLFFYTRYHSVELINDMKTKYMGNKLEIYIYIPYMVQKVREKNAVIVQFIYFRVECVRLLNTYDIY